ncbi:MAG: DUF3810 domain-containing protein [Planctomycetes bacterium]|nr:DUF3810 domain-containing protein [Planctomycetota bacterium]
MSAPEHPIASATPSDRPAQLARGAALFAFGLLVAAFAFLGVVAPETVERVYARGVYPWVQAGLAGLARLSPIALGETLLLLLIGIACLRTVRGILAWRRGQRRLRNLLARAFAQVLGFAGVLLFLFVVLWGFNHARLPVATQFGLVPQAVSKERLTETILRLGERAAAARPPELGGEVHRCLPADWRERIADAYETAGAQWPVLAGPRPTLRAPLISWLMTLSSVTGIYSPFTGEPNVNEHMPDLQKPFVALHEVAHLRGYAREDEANFIAWWVGSRSSDPLTRYSCELNAYRIAIAELHAVDPLEAQLLMTGAPRAIAGDIAAIRAYWLGQPQLATKVLSSISTTTNDLYLKSAGHADGVQSYGRMLDLLIAALED